MNPTKTTANLLPALLIARALKHDWAWVIDAKGRPPTSWDDAQAWYDETQREVEAKHEAVYLNQYDFKMEVGGSGNGDAARADADRLADAFAPDLDGAPAPCRVDDHGYYAWQVLPAGTAIVQTFDALPVGADRRGVERARLVIPAKGNGDVILTILKGAIADDLRVLRRVAVGLGETPTVQALDAHIAARRAAA